MRIKILVGLGVIMLISFLAFGFFAFPIAIPICSVIGLIYGIENKDQTFIRWSSATLLIGIAFIIYTLLLINNM